MNVRAKIVRRGLSVRMSGSKYRHLAVGRVGPSRAHSIIWKDMSIPTMPVSTRHGRRATFELEWNSTYRIVIVPQDRVVRGNPTSREGRGKLGWQLAGLSLHYSNLLIETVPSAS